ILLTSCIIAANRASMSAGVGWSIWCWASPKPARRRRPAIRRHAHRIGAVCYVLWGILHIGAGAVVLYRLAAKGGTDALAVIGSVVPAEELPQGLGGVASAVLAQHAWNLAVFGFFAAIVGAGLNWRNSRIGYWLNLGVVSGADLGFVFAILIPGHIRLVDGLWGPALWVLAVIFSTIGLLTSPDETRLTR